MSRTIVNTLTVHEIRDKRKQRLKRSHISFENFMHIFLLQSGSAPLAVSAEYQNLTLPHKKYV
jgi:hypothetical protein